MRQLNASYNASVVRLSTHCTSRESAPSLDTATSRARVIAAILEKRVYHVGTQLTAATTMEWGALVLQ